MLCDCMYMHADVMKVCCNYTIMKVIVDLLTNHFLRAFYKLNNKAKKLVWYTVESTVV